MCTQPAPSTAYVYVKSEEEIKLEKDEQEWKKKTEEDMKMKEEERLQKAKIEEEKKKVEEQNKELVI